MDRITLSVGNSRKSVNWRSVTMSWADFCERCSRPKRTKETFATYLSINRDSQADIKDVGGFVAATLNGPRRKRQAVISRSAVTLDLDECMGMSADDVWQRVREAIPSVAVCMYSTHKHSPESPRLRIVVPLSHPVPADTYEPVARMAARVMGVIDLCDPTTFDPSRLFYWPSCSIDAEFWAQSCDGDGLMVTSILGLYDRDWSDSANWPRVPGEEHKAIETATRSGSGGTLQDPLAKEGVVGLFCRAYSPIEAGIEALLPDVYRKGSGGRYTYIGGQTSNGLVIYDLDGDGIGRWAYSNHSTDPACGIACNIFDLVRIHHFAHLDEHSRAKGENLPSYKAMIEFAASDTKVKSQIIDERMADFSDIEVPADEDEDNEEKAQKDTEDKKDDREWEDKLETNKKTGEILPTVGNIITILECDPRLKGIIGYNQMTERMVKLRRPFWGHRGPWEDTDDACLRIYFERKYGIVAKEKIYDATVYMQTRNAFHPVRDYLNGLPAWDGGESLVERVFIDYLGAEDSPLNRALSRKFFAACVARVMKPGCKFDYCLTLMGPEGIGKSTIFRRLAGDEWFTDAPYTLEGKDFMEQIVGVWIVELSELAASSRSDQSRIKQVISQQVDRYRAAYGRRVADHPRQCVIVATTNEDNPLKGDTGNRRFWLLPVSSTAYKPLEDIDKQRDRIWAEALYIYNNGETLYLDMEMEIQMRERQKERNINADDPMPQMLADFLEAELPADWRTSWDLYRRRRFWQGNESVDFATEPRVCFSACEFICERLGRDMNASDYNALSRRVSTMMKEHPEWTHQGGNLSGHAVNVYGRQKYWVRAPSP